MSRALLPGSKSATYRFLRRHSASSDANILSFFGGKYTIPDESYSTFLGLYAEDAGKYALGLIEQKKDTFPFFLDVDFDVGTVSDRLQTLGDIMQIVKTELMLDLLCSFKDELNITGDVEEIAQKAVYEGSCIAHRKMEAYHIIFPYLVVNKDAALCLTVILQKYLQHQYPEKQWQKIIDKTVAQHNGLRMLGSFKKEKINGSFYVPCEIDFINNTVTDRPISLETLEQYSIRRILSGNDVLRICDLSLIEMPSDDQDSDSNKTQPGIVVPVDTLRKAVMALPSQYYGSKSYPDWSRIIWTIKNLACRGNYEKEGKVLAHDFSQQDPTVYCEKSVDQLWSKARQGCGRLLGWKSLLSVIRSLGMHDLYTEIQAELPVLADWNRNDLLHKLCSTVDGIDPVDCNFAIEQDTIQFKSKNIQGHIDKRDLGVFVEEEFKCYLDSEIPVPGALSILHKDIRDDVSFNVTFDKDDDSALLSASNMSVTWHHPWTEDGFLTVQLQGIRKGNAIQRKKTIQYIQRRIEMGMQQYLYQNYGITQAHFTNCTFNINLQNEDNRHPEGILNQMLIQKHPELKQTWKFAPEVKSNNCNGLYHCSEKTGTIWVQTHNSAVEEILRKAYQDVPGVNTEDLKYIQTRRGIMDLRCEFAGSVLDVEFESKLDSNLDLFAVRNGVMDMSTKTFRKTKPEDYVRTYANWEYSEKESVKYKDELLKFMSEVFPVKEERKVFLHYVAGLLSGRRTIKKMLILTDKRDGNNGKSTIVALLKVFFGGLSKCCNKLLNKSSFDRDKDSHDAGLEPFVGIRLTILEELKRHNKIDDGLTKFLTGGCGVLVEGRRCGSNERFRFVWQSGLLCVFNEGDCPQFDVTDAAFVGRLLVAPMRSKFVASNSPELLSQQYTYLADPNICERFELWRSALLDLLKEFYTQTLYDEDIPDEMKEWRAGIAERDNVLGSWLESTVQHSEDLDNYVLISDLKEKYKSIYCETKPKLASHEFTRVAKAWFNLKTGYLFKDMDRVKLTTGVWKTERGVVRFCKYICAK